MTKQSTPNMSETAFGFARERTIASEVLIKGSDVFQIDLTGAIGPRAAISAAKVRALLDTPRAAGGVAFTINSSGGDCAESMVIYRLFRSLPGPVIGTACGDCESAAMTVLLAAGYRRATKGTTMLLHRCFRHRVNMPARANAADMRRIAKHLAARDRDVIDIFAARTGFDRRWFEREMKNENLLSEPDAIETGIVHEIIGLTGALNPAWADFAPQVKGDSMQCSVGSIHVPRRFLTANHIEACRTLGRVGGVLPPQAKGV
jgi:ATP-dependent protease ClpP protease subunit